MTAEADLENFIRGALAEQGFMRLVGAELDEVAPGRCVLSVGFRPELTQQNGFFHGGVVGFLFDNATAAAAGTMLRDFRKEGVLTAEYKLNILSPALGERLLCRAEVVKPGRMLTVVEGKVHSLDGRGGEKLVAVGLATLAVVTLDR